MQLSKNFSLAEFLRSETAVKKGIDNKPTVKQIENIRWMCLHVLQPIRAHFGKPMKITSGFRNAELNRAVGGVENSYHRCLGYNAAADFKIEGVPVKTLFNYIAASDLPYTKVILEFDNWVHIAVDRPRNTALIAEKIGGKVRYRVYQAAKVTLESGWIKKAKDSICRWFGC